jgi:WD40 repeat protein
MFRLDRAARGLPVRAALVPILLAAMGCSVSLFATPAPPTAAPPTATETPVPTLVVEDTPEPPTATPEAEEVTSEPPVSANAITQDTVRDVEERRAFDVSQSVLLVSEFQPGSHLLATYGFDKIVRIFDADSTDLLYELVGHGDYGFGLAWSPDGERLASGGDYTAKVWDSSNGELLSSTAVGSWGFRLSWHPDGDRFAIVGDPSSRLEIVGADGGVLDQLRPSQYALWSVAYSPDGALLATADTEAQVFIFDADTLENVRELTSGGTVWDLEFSPDASLLAACDDGGRVEIWETENWSRTLTEQAYVDDCSDGIFSPSGDLYFTGGDDGKLIAWDPETGAQLATISVGRFIWWVGISDDGELIALAMDDGSVRILGLP